MAHEAAYRLDRGLVSLKWLLQEKWTEQVIHCTGGGSVQKKVVQVSQRWCSVQPGIGANVFRHTFCIQNGADALSLILQFISDARVSCFGIALENSVHGRAARSEKEEKNEKKFRDSGGLFISCIVHFSGPTCFPSSLVCHYFTSLEYNSKRNTSILFT